MAVLVVVVAAVLHRVPSVVARAVGREVEELSLGWGRRPVEGLSRGSVSRERQVRHPEQQARVDARVDADGWCVAISTVVISEASVWVAANVPVFDVRRRIGNGARSRTHCGMRCFRFVYVRRLRTKLASYVSKISSWCILAGCDKRFLISKKKRSYAPFLAHVFMVFPVCASRTLAKTVRVLCTTVFPFP